MSTRKALPDQIGRYPVTRLLGTGAMGCVYLARDTELERDVAIKTVRMPPGSSGEHEAFLVRFRNEARAVARLRHRSIVAVYDVGNDPEVGPYLVFEYIEGSNLKDIVRVKGPLAPPQVVALTEQVGEALDAAHREGIIHRDLKPENLLIGGDGLVRLADFGVARVPDAALTGEGQFLGTPCYGAPETLRGAPAGPLSDQFSFAAVVYEAATGARAFPGADALAVAHHVIHDDPLPPSRAAPAGVLLPPAVDAVIMRGLSKKPELRFDQLSAFVAALRDAYESAGVSLVGDADVTMPAMLARPRRSSVAPPPREKLRLWPFALVLAVGFAAVVQLAPTPPSRGEGVPEPGPLATTSSGADASADLPLLAVDDGGWVDAADALTTDGGELADASDDATTESDADALVASDAAPAPGLEGLSTFEREERAKDALERAQRSLSAGDRAAAASALDEAERYDPEHPDIADLRRKL